jgi:hypothetical protein
MAMFDTEGHEPRGLKLKREMGQAHVRYVYITETIFSDLYLIVFNSRYPTRPIDRRKIDSSIRYEVLQIRSGRVRNAKMTPPIRIERFNDRLDQNDVILTVDLARNPDPGQS